MVENKFLKLLRKLEGEEGEDDSLTRIALQSVDNETDKNQNTIDLRNILLGNQDSPSFHKNPAPPLSGSSTFILSRSISMLGAFVELSIKGRPQSKEIITIQCNINNPEKDTLHDLVLRLNLSSGLQYVRESTVLGTERISDLEGTSPVLLPQGLSIRPLEPAKTLSIVIQVEIEPSLEDGTTLLTRAILLKEDELLEETYGELMVMAQPSFIHRNCRIEANSREKVTPNQELLVRYFVINSGSGPATRVILRGSIPHLTAYIRQSTQVDGVTVLDLGEMSQIFSEKGLYLGTIPPKGKKEVTYRTKVHYPLEQGIKIWAKGEILLDQLTPFELEPIEFVTDSKPDFSVPGRNIFQSSRRPPEGAHPSEPGLLEPGETVTLKILYYNSGDAHAHNTTFEIVPPTHTTYVRGSTKWNGNPLSDVGPGSPLFPTASGGGVNIGTIEVNEEGEVSVQFCINSPLENNLLLESEAYIKCDELSRQKLGTILYKVRSLPDFSDPVVNKMEVEPRGEVEPGDILTYTLYLKNLGRTHARNVVLKSRIPTNTAYLPNSMYWNGKRVPDIDGFSSVFTTQGFKIECVKVEELHTMSFQININDGLENGTKLETFAQIFADGIESVTPKPVFSTVKSWADFSDPKTSFVETHPQGSVIPGDIITYYIHFKNIGKVTAKNLVIKGVIPFRTSSLPNKTKLNGFPVADEDKVSLVFVPNGLPVGDLRVNERGTVTVQVKINSPLEKGTIITGNFQILSDDSLPLTLEAPELLVRSMPDFSSADENFLEVYPEGDVAPDEVLTYVLHYKNNGNDDAQNVSFHIKLPEGTVYEKGSTKLNGFIISDRDDKSPLLMDGGLRIGTIESKGTGNVSFQIKVKNDVAHGAIIATGGTIDCQGLPPFVTGIIQNKVCTVADFGDLTKNYLELFPSDVIYPGDMATCTLHYKNCGRMPASGVRLKLYLPSQITYLPNSTTINSLPVPDENGNSILLIEEGFAVGTVAPGKLGTVAPGESGSVSLKAQVHFPLDNGATITAKGSIYTENGQVVPLAPVKGTISSSPRFDDKNFNFIEVVEGGRSSSSKLTYVANFKNTGNAVAYNVNIKGGLDSRVEYISGTTRVNGVTVPDSGFLSSCFTEQGLNIGNIFPEEEWNLAFEVTYDDILQAIPYPVMVLTSEGTDKEWIIEG